MPDTIQDDPSAFLLIDAKRAIQISMDSFREFFPEALNANPMLEEIELREDGKAWLVTIGFDSARPRKMNLLGGDFGGLDRFYKQFAVNGQTGTVNSIKIRKV